ncbi:fatty acid desaturase [Kurthia senegalensis]|uniref:fatty acid desaturase n=1 Tax=Kurthia senegalensis TaxID=1033740 RepID=UPI0002890D5F|nr:fatty acid desaturase [Kurthia senegalensis]
MTDREKIKELKKAVAPFSKSQTFISVRQLLNTLVPLLILWGIGYGTFSNFPVVSVICAIVASAFVVRTFIIFHDCTHGSFFKNKKANKIIGNITGVLTTFPYEQWKREHLIHHASSSNLDERGIGDIWMMTTQEYDEATKWQRFCYRSYRNPLVMFGLGPLFLILIVNRVNAKNAKKKERNNTYFTTIMLFVMLVGLSLLFGWQAMLVVQGISMYIAAMLGIWLFYIQHTFEESYFDHKGQWDYVKAAVEGSSYYQLPKVLQWVSGNIGYHHVHHLAPRIPNYELQQAHEQTPPLQQVTTITMKTSIESLRYKLYDEASKRFMTFKEYGQCKSVSRGDLL